MSHAVVQPTPIPLMPRASRVLMLIASGILLGACAASRPMPVPAPIPARSASAVGFEKRLEETAALAARQGRLADEATALELLVILRPDSETLATRRQALQERIATATQDRTRRGADAFKRGLLDVATSQYLAALALSPDDEIAANGLRAIERERNRRLLVAKQRDRVTTPAPGNGD